MNQKPPQHQHQNQSNQNLQKNNTDSLNPLKNNELYNCLGTIVNTVGLKGEIKIITNSDFISQRFKHNAKLYYFTNNDIFELQVDSYRMKGENVIAKLIGIDSISKAELLKNIEIFVLKKEVKLASDDFFIKDIINYKVFDEDNVEIGIVVSFWENKFYKNLDIKTIDGKIINIPLTKNVIKNIIKKNSILNLNVKFSTLI